MSRENAQLPANGHLLAKMMFMAMVEMFCHRDFRTCAGKESIPLTSDQSGGVERPIVIFENETGAVACVHGRIDIDSSPAVLDQLLAFLQSPHPSVVSVDLSGVTHLDSSGVATLIEALRVAQRNKTQLRLQGLHDRLLHLFDSTGILSLFNGPATSQSGCESD